MFGLAAEEHGYPFNQISPRMLWWGRGGVAGWGSICGALPPAAMFIAAVTDEETQIAIINEMMAWYKDAAFPIYQPKDELPTTVANSTLCHVSITKFLAQGPWTMDSTEKKYRCGGLSADVARWTVELLNDFTDLASFEAKHKLAPDVAECKACHGTFTQGKDSCNECHTLEDPHPDGF
ncbi:C-GCAxxG-C-C family protein [Candidatus Contubernalis alkaliaceticus]|uniref:C-GCAxxG-C-C family protein n=1 Tax=Candidatus Contubernalis alkaliaceticus TaxID=338645 RepID=UPI001F4BDC4E|nr:C-GCAxxG-C-C family protein [Candidatus Contubernalis alkalaceticus]UNC92773.1 C_GCAxxG_C_C family protein [Candidatus Contubernalis alkalaceticus]